MPTLVCHNKNPCFPPARDFRAINHAMTMIGHGRITTMPAVRGVLRTALLCPRPIRGSTDGCSRTQGATLARSDRP